ncbi:MAG: protein kinase [Polyangiaceae bacterium]|nr:protein kinase [Polyangiaceae bacterium]
MGQHKTVIVVKRCKLCGQRFTNDAAFCPFDAEPLEHLPAVFDPAADALIGTLIDGRYHVIEALGEGGMGTVYRVQHRALQRVFAMKVLRRDLAREVDLAGRFIQEARSAATINHPNVVQITDFGTLPGGTPYFVMEMLEGQPLSRLLKTGGPLPAVRAVRLLLQAAAGIGAAHRAGVVHRDLKPENIFVLGGQGSDHVKILDFGVAKIAGSAKLTRTGMVFGSPHYMSPEQASGQPVDHRADIYALGVVMYELFTGRVPFEADTFMGVLTKQMFMAPERFQERLAEAADLGALEDVTLRCLEKKPEDRYPTIDALVADVQDVVQLGSGVQLEIRPSRISAVLRSSGDFRLADELELPLPYEIHAARNARVLSDRRYHWALGAIAVAALLLTGALASLLWVRIDRERFALPVAPLPALNCAAIAPPTIVDQAPATVDQAPAPLVVSAEAAAPTAARVKLPQPARLGPTRALAPARIASPSAEPADPAQTAPPAPTKPASVSGSPDIVNPWAK